MPDFETQGTFPSTWAAMFRLLHPGWVGRLPGFLSSFCLRLTAKCLRVGKPSLSQQGLAFKTFVSLKSLGWIMNLSLSLHSWFNILIPPKAKDASSRRMRDPAQLGKLGEKGTPVNFRKMVPVTLDTNPVYKKAGSCFVSTQQYWARRDWFRNPSRGLHPLTACLSWAGVFRNEDRLEVGAPMPATGRGSGRHGQL